MSDSQTHSDADSQAPAPVSEAAAARDVGQIKITDWERRELPAVSGKREDRYQAVVKQSVLNQIHRHGLSTTDIEVCGVLVGNVYHDPSGPWLYIEKAIEGNHATQRAAQVTFTADTWAHIQAIMDKDYPEKRILGWYHTHPGFGIFLSDMDVFIQENFFPEPWQVAFVYDPKAKEEGLFFWKEGAPDTEKFLREEDAPVEETTRTVREPKDVSGKGLGAMMGDTAQFAERLESIEKRQKFIIALMMLIGLIALAWPLAVTIYLPELMQQKSNLPPIKLPADDPTSQPVR
jgi:proteasome lid subunit RPN8/RPN11